VSSPRRRGVLHAVLTVVAIPAIPAISAALGMTAPAQARTVFTNTDEVRACLPLPGGDTLVGTGGGLVRVDADGLARRGLAVARALRPDEIHAVRLDVDSDETQRVAEQWARSGFDVGLEVVPAPYREPGGPIRAEVDVLQRQGHRLVSVVAPAFGLRWWQRPLHEDESRRVRKALAEVGDTAVIECRLPVGGVPGTPAPSAQEGAPAVTPPR